MCMMLYLGSDIELPLIPWDDEAKQSLCVSELSELNESVREQFSKPFVYYIGAHEGCGCGFSFGTYEVIGEDDQLAYEQGRDSVLELFNYLRVNIEHTDKFELYSCWSGDEAVKPESIKKIFLSKFTIDNYFEFKEKQFIDIYK